MSASCSSRCEVLVCLNHAISNYRKFARLADGFYKKRKREIYLEFFLWNARDFDGVD